MSKSTAHNEAPQAIDTTTPCTIGVTIVPLSADIDADKKIRRLKIAPRGRVQARDGRFFDFNPEVLAARADREGVSIPLDIDHAIPLKGPRGEKADAVGWINNLSAEADGLYADVELLDAGLAALAARSHRYLSPGVTHLKDGTVNWIHSVALVAAPALAMPAVASAGAPQDPNPTPTTQPERSMKQIAAALGLNAEASEDACLSAIGKLSDGKVDQAVHDETVKKLGEASANLAALQTAVDSTKVDAVLEKALKDKKIVPAQREHYANLASTPEGLANVEKLIEAMPAQLSASGMDELTLPDDADLTDPNVLAQKAQAHQAAQATLGISVSIADAVNHVKASGAAA
ncbi:MAG: phage protease [Pseudomonadota bacterium]